MTKRKFGTELSAPVVAGNDTTTDMPVAYGKELQGAIQYFTTLAERDAWTSVFRTRLKGTIAFVENNEDREPAWFKWTGKNDDGSDGNWTAVKMVNISGSSGSSSSLGIEIDDGTTNASGIETINIIGGTLSVSDEDNKTATLNMLQNWQPMNGDTGGKANTVIVEEPLQVYPDPDKADTMKLMLKHGLFEPKGNPSYLAYLSQNEEITGKYNNSNANHIGTLWFDNVIIKDKSFIQYDINNKAFGIQEADDKDPNITGGMLYLISFRASLKGKAPDDGFVRAYLMKKKVTPLDTDEYFKDVNGDIMAVEKHYKKGDVLGDLDVLGIANAKGLEEFTCHVIDNFTSDNIILNNRTQGGTGLLIQALTSDRKTGEALLEYENDTKQSINFDSYYLGEGRASIDWVVQQDIPVKEGDAGQGQTDINGLHFYNVTKMSMGIESKHLVFEGNGKDLCYFNFGKIFNAEETKILRGKEISFSGVLTDKKNAFKVMLVKWTGTPDEYTKKIITDVNNMQPVFEKNWVKVDELFIPENALGVDYDVSCEFTIPKDANNYAVIIAPNDKQIPVSLKLKKFTVDVAEPFMAHVLKTTENLNETHLSLSDEYKELVMDTQGFASLRYTFTNKPIPMPVGELRKGKADISLDPSINKIAGSGANGGEGAIVFNSDGQATINTQLMLQSEQPKGTNNTATFWYSTVNSKSGVLNKIPDSETTFTVYGGNVPAVYSMNSFLIDVQSNDRIVLSSESDKADGAYMECTNDSKPMLKTTINFEELISTSEY